LRLHGKDWKKVEDFIGTRTGAQIRSHAQKYFLRIEEELNCTGLAFASQNSKGEEGEDPYGSEDDEPSSLNGDASLHNLD
jgi:hypothetical protein